MRSLIISAALLVVLVHGGYSVNSYPTTPSYPTSPPSYPVPKKYPVAPSYPVKANYPSPQPDYAQQPSYSASPASTPSYMFSDSGVGSESEYTTYTPPSEYRKRAKARTAHNRHFQRRALQPIRRFQQKKQ